MTGKFFCRIKENIKKLASNKSFLTFAALFCLVAVFCTMSVFIFSDISRRTDIEVGANDSTDSDMDVLTIDGKEMRGVWVATVSNINFPSKPGLSEKQLKAELDDIVATAKAANLNAIFFQARPCADAMYPSKIFPWSQYLTGTQGKAPENDFDPLGYIIEMAHKNGIELHAWINPYRVTSGTASNPSHNINSLCDTSPARLNPDWCVPYADGKMYFDPGKAGVIDLTVKGVEEILENYPTVDGIHFDDYFYPYPVSGATFDDAETYAASGTALMIDDWRRENVNTLVRSTYNAIKAINPKCSFGVSPFGIYANKSSNTPLVGSNTNGLEAYKTLYCDATAWAIGGYVDYLAPQDYWAFSTSAAPFDEVARWWNAVLDGTDCDLYIGHAIYKIGDFPKNEMLQQVEFARTLLKYKGSIFYGYAQLKANTQGFTDDIAKMYGEEKIYGDIASTGETPKINYPSNGTRTVNQTAYYLGSSDPAYPLYLNGSKVSRTKDGYFSLFTNLEAGQNNVFMTQNGENVTYSVTRTTAGDGVVREMDKYEITDISPFDETWISGGETLLLSCTAPAGSTVTATIGSTTQVLKPTLYYSSKAKYVKEVYTGSITFASLAKEGETYDLGTLKFLATNGTESAVKSAGLVRQIGDGAYLYAEVAKDYSYLKISPSSSFYDDYLPASRGMRDYVTGLSNGYYHLKFGGYVAMEDVNFVEGEPLYKNRLTSAAVEVFESDVQNYDGNTTDIRFGVLENVPCNVTVDGKNIKIVLYETTPSYLPTVNMVKNPMIESVSGAKYGENSVIYTAKLKDADNFYGFNVVYENGMLTVKLNNPLKLTAGDLPLADKTILVDAGHGGNDIGARGPSSVETAMYENGLNLAIANALAQRLTQLGANVVTVRTTDKTVSIYDRLDFISEVVPDLLISVHQNSVADTVNADNARGFHALYSNNSGILFAKTVSGVVSKSLHRYERTPAYQMLAMVRDHRFPSTLCEMCFISNVSEFQASMFDGSVERAAGALTDGIIAFYEKQAEYAKY